MTVTYCWLKEGKRREKRRLGREREMERGRGEGRVRKKEKKQANKLIGTPNFVT